MEQNVECSNPSNLLCGLLDTFSCAAYILDDEKNLIMNEKAQELWDVYTKYKRLMFDNTKKGPLPFKVIRANRKTSARINVIQYILKAIPYDKTLEV